MKNPYFLLAAATLLVGSLSAAATATQAITMQINSTSSITASGNPATLAVTLDADGAGSASDSTTTYTVVSNSSSSPGDKLKITGAITTGGDMPTNCVLTANLASNDGTSAGALTLSSSAVDLVDKLPALVSDTASITYDFSVSNGWEIATQTISRTVTLTLLSS